MSEQTGLRLPKNVRPIHYDLTMKPDFKKFTFEGSVKICYNANSSNPTSKIIVNAIDLDITKGYIDSPACDQSCPMTNVRYCKESETATIEFGNAIPVTGDLTLEFSGILNDRMQGFYRSSFTINDSTVYAATTQFAPISARRAFPCWDEPAIKATFSVTLIHDRYTKVQREGESKLVEYPNVALSNMPIIEQAGEDVITTRFDKSVKMSTYLLAFTVGPFDFVEGTDGKRQHRVFTVPGKKEQGQFGLDISIRSLKFYEQYFDIEYPLKKMDFIAIPDFAFGAMENWGLVTYREIALLVHPDNTPTSQKQAIALTIAHEVAHQWFGNLVTMEWWTHLWLNEGFATFMQFLCIGNLIPEWDIWSQYAAKIHIPALELDALDSSHPIEVPVNNASEIDKIFDDISYKKGASVIRMAHQYVGDDCFRRGMHAYLTKFAYGNAVTENLWECLEQASSKPVGKLMSGWTSKKGYPWLSIKYHSRESCNSVKLSISQSKFTADGSTDSSYMWMIPIDTITGSDPTKTASLGLLDDKDAVVTVDGVGDSWIKLNTGFVGLYRAAYSEELSDKLLPAISTQTLPPIDRIGLQNDLFALCQAGKAKTSALLKLLKANESETNYAVWSSIDNCFLNLSLLLYNTDYRDKLQEFGKEVYANIFKKLTWVPQADEAHADSMLRALVINRLVSFGDENVIREALSKYKAYLDGVETIAADLRCAVFRAVSSYGDEEEFKSLFELHRSTKDNEEKINLQLSISATEHVARLAQVYDFAFSDGVRNQDKLFMFQALGITRPSAAWEAFQKYANKFTKMYGDNHLMQRAIKFVTCNLVGETHACEVSQFFEKNKFPGSELTIQQSLERIRTFSDWLARDGDDIKSFLST